MPKQSDLCLINRKGLSWCLATPKFTSNSLIQFVPNDVLVTEERDEAYYICNSSNDIEWELVYPMETQIERKSVTRLTKVVI